jgi:GT2 family glycosyltransferase
VITFPAVAVPRVSVVMVTHDAWEWVERALAALARHTRPVYEVVVVDNASTPATRRRLHEEVAGARLIENASNEGFGTGCNQGAAAARGEVIVLLNSDAFVHAGWLEPLLELLDADPGCAAVAPRVLNLDGSLQEAGALVARDGTTAVCAFEPDFSRRVDYAGAECLLVRRTAFEAAGGFADVYAPAYYEDVELCFALADAGATVRYEPRSTVTHALHGSDGPDAARALVERNRPVFAARWTDQLADRPPGVEPALPRRQLEARDVHTPVRVLVVGDSVPAPAGVRVTAVGAPAGGEPEVEVVAEPDDWSAWLGERRFFYDVVVTRDEPVPALAAALAVTQPQALRATGALDASRLRGLLVAAGVA